MKNSWALLALVSVFIVAVYLRREQVERAAKEPAEPAATRGNADVSISVAGRADSFAAVGSLADASASPTAEGSSSASQIEPPQQSAREKMKALLEAVKSRETAWVYLEALVDQTSLESTALPTPAFAFVRDDELPPGEKTQVESVRQSLAVEGRRLLVTRDLRTGSLQFHEMGARLPVEFIPERVRDFLTEEDVAWVQARIDFNSIERSQARARARAQRR